MKARRSSAGRWCCAAAGAFAMSTGNAAGFEDDRDNLLVYVSDRLIHDDNLYRQPDGFIDLADPQGRSIKGDDYLNRATFGIDGRWSLSQQLVKLVLAVDDNRYQENDSLDHVSGTGRFSWEWALGGHWSGDLAADYDRALVNFANSRVFAKDLLDQRSYHGTLRYQIGPRWSLFAGGKHTEGAHSFDPRKIDDFKTDVGFGGLRLESATGSKLDAQYSYTKARFPDGATIAGVPFDRNYNQRDESLRWQHEFSPRWSIDAKGGYVDRNYLTSKNENFSGDVWRVSLEWRPTIKTQLAFAAFRELQAYVDAESNYFVGKGGSIQPLWSPREKIQVAIFLSYEDQQFLGSAIDPVLTEGRRDKLKTGMVSVAYLPRKPWKLEVSYRYEDRDSNRDFLAYVDSTVSFAAKFTF